MDAELAEIDRDGAIAEALDGMGLTRGQLLRRTAVGAAGASVAAGGLLATAPSALAAKNARTDRTILQFALIFEHLGADFYGRAASSGALSGKTQLFAETLHQHEVAHVAFVQGAIRALGGTPNPPPAFHFGTIPEHAARFRSTAEAVEQLCVEVINGAGPLVTRPTLAAAGELVSVEARHVSWIRQIIGVTPAPAAFDAHATATQAKRVVRSAGLIKSF